MKQHFPGDPVIANPREEFGPGIAVYISKGGTRVPPGGKTGDVTIRKPDGQAIGRFGEKTAYLLEFRKPYSDAQLVKIIEAGQTSPREIPLEQVPIVEAARVADREDHKVFEQQFAGIGSSGTYGSLDGRSGRRPTRNKKEAGK